MSRLKLFVGDAFSDSDGNEWTIVQIDSAKDRVVLEDEAGEQGVMSLETMLDEIQSGDLERLGPDDIPPVGKSTGRD